MGKKENIVFRLTDTVTEKIGRAIRLIALPIMLIISVEVVSRYVFNSPTRWAWQISTHLFGVLSLFAGAYALLHGRHIRVEVLYERFGSRLKLASSVLTAILLPHLHRVAGVARIRDGGNVSWEQRGSQGDD